MKLSIKNAIGWSFLVFLLIGGIGTLFVYYPDFQRKPILSLVVVWAVALIIGISGFINSQRPNGKLSLIVLFSISSLLLNFSIRTLSQYFPGIIWIVLLLVAYFTAWLLPIQNPELAKALRDWQLRISIFGTSIFFVILILVSLGLSILGNITYQQTHLIFIGLLSATLALSLVP